MIVHLRVVPGFWVAVEEARRPELRSQPVVLGGLPHQRGTVREAGFEALRRGVRPGMTLSQAYAQCPEGVFLLPDLPTYEAAWEVVCDLLREFTPAVEPVEMGQAACDLSGCERLWGDAARAARAIAERVRQAAGVLPWLGVASNRLVAQLASTAVGAEGITVIPPGQEQHFLADLPLTLLPGVDPRLALTFQVLGLQTIGQFAALPLPSVRQRFGPAGERLHTYAHGIDPRPVSPPPPKPAVSTRRECDEGTIEEAVELLQHLAEECAAKLQERRLAGTVVELLLEWAPHPPTPPLPAWERGELTDEDGRSLVPLPPHPIAPIPLTTTPPSPNTACSPGPLSRAGCNPGTRWEPGGRGGEGIPIPYRIHSMLPQPPQHISRDPDPPIAAVEGHTSGNALTPTGAGLNPACSHTKAKTVIRTPTDTALRLIEAAQRLLLQRWAPNQRLQAIELTVSEFPGPKQLAFPELNRIDQVGGLAGMSPERLQALAEQEQVLAARYGDTSFRHVTQIDPGNILTERRFRWQPGLPGEMA